VKISLEEVTALDSAGAWLLQGRIRQLEAAGRTVSLEGLNNRTGPLMGALARLGPLTSEGLERREPGRLEAVGRMANENAREYVDYLAFLGSLGVTALALLRRPTRFRWRALFHFMETAGVQGLPIVGLLSFLLGVVIAYQGGVQLRQYGANVYIADLVGLAMVRELAPLLTAIIVAGRTGSAIAAQIGTMKVTEEIDALRALGIAPMEIVALPRVLALVLVLPLLTVFADAMGLLGGMLIGSSVLGLSPGSFMDRVGEAVTVESYLIGVGKAPVFAAIVATVGCFHGFQVAGSAESVGRRTTVSVVQAIFLVIIVDAAFSILFSELGL
jgi:phospholipid/cholesterol/gamma-HCH transport system permease protein